MKFKITRLLFNLLIIQETVSEITKSLREYIESKRNLQKYIVTTSVDYEKDQRVLVEENLILNLQDYVPINESFKLKDKVLNVSVFQTDQEYDCRIRKYKNETIISGYSIDLLRSIQDILHFK